MATQIRPPMSPPTGKLVTTIIRNNEISMPWETGRPGAPSSSGAIVKPKSNITVIPKTNTKASNNTRAAKSRKPTRLSLGIASKVSPAYAPLSADPGHFRLTIA